MRTGIRSEAISVVQPTPPRVTEDCVAPDIIDVLVVNAALYVMCVGNDRNL